MDNVAGWILEVDRGSLLPYKGNYSAWLLQKQNRLDMEHSKQVRAEPCATPFEACPVRTVQNNPGVAPPPPSLSVVSPLALPPSLFPPDPTLYPGRNAENRRVLSLARPPSSTQAQIAKRLESELDWIRNGRASVSKARAKNYEKAVAERKEGAAKLQQLSEG